MVAFADFLFFVGTLGLLLLAPTALGLCFLSPGQRSWSWFSISALAVAVIGPVAVGAFSGLRAVPPAATLPPRRG